nr:MAG TPA: hypothetical protein [Caudoviricetes sp.]
MLTKEERAAIAARVASYDGGILTWTTLYECLLDAPITGDVSIEEDSKYVIDCLIDLCDTSDMVELPRDKDGEVIRIGDTVYDSVGDEYKVTGYKTLFEDTNITLSNGSEVAYTEMYPHKLTHKQPVTIESLVARIKRVMDDDSTTVWAYDELDDIADQLEKLGDSDEA